MKEYKLKQGKIGKWIINSYKNIESTVVNTHKKIENKFIKAFLEESKKDNKN